MNLPTPRSSRRSFETTGRSSRTSPMSCTGACHLFQTSIIRPCTHAGGMLMSVHWRGWLLFLAETQRKILFSAGYRNFFAISAADLQKILFHNWTGMPSARSADQGCTWHSRCTDKRLLLVLARYRGKTRSTDWSCDATCRWSYRPMWDETFY